MKIYDESSKFHLTFDAVIAETRENAFIIPEAAEGPRFSPMIEELSKGKDGRRWERQLLTVFQSIR
jgi:hypothetical protein